MSERYKTIVEPEAPKGFDITVTHRDPKTGLIVKKDPYILRVCGQEGSNSKSRYWERPAGSGNLFDKNNNPIGRWEYEEKALPNGLKSRVGKFVAGAKHISWEAPLTQDQKIARENAALRAELDALKAEKDKSASAPKKDKGA